MNDQPNLAITPPAAGESTSSALTAACLDATRDSILADRQRATDDRAREALWRAAEFVEKARKILRTLEKKTAATTK